ncbi:unnamed protein product [Fraxinus pennsylvanica]|uniref:AAA+ ATPase domain-containing protein n=1 Tax=Fraxinus pennsylvanica TaxID=56036 RepID=A0AAD1YNX8_9LAMI|nr:unnamed protein product [Fraxinus pennsylvanica]
MHLTVYYNYKIPEGHFTSSVYSNGDGGDRDSAGGGGKKPPPAKRVWRRRRASAVLSATHTGSAAPSPPERPRSSASRQKDHDLQRLEAQRNDLNARVRSLKEELQLLQEPGSYVGEVVKVMGKSKVLVKVHPEGKYVVDIDKNIDITKITPSMRVALRNDSYVLHLILPSKVDPLVNLMKVEKVPDSTYDMIGGLDQQIKEIKEVIELPIKHPELFESLGIAQPKGVLLYGPPGTGKTLLARAVAHHTDCTFIRVSGSELVQKYIGEGSRMVRELFVMAREHAPSIIFMDEIDSIGSARMESGSGNGDSEVQRTMLELLNQLDGFEASNKIKVLMATNRIDILDQALLRPGRIDRKIEFPNPNEESRFDILKIHSRKMNLTRGIDLKKIAEKMNGASGAELKAVCTEAGMFALRERRVHVTQEDFEMAVAKVMKKETDKNMSLRKLWKWRNQDADVVDGGRQPPPPPMPWTVACDDLVEATVKPMVAMREVSLS